MTSLDQIGIVLNGTYVESLVMGGSAFVSGDIWQGDEVLQVEGQDVSSQDIEKHIIGCDIAGTSVSILFRRTNSQVSNRSNLPGATLPRTDTRLLLAGHQPDAATHQLH